MPGFLCVTCISHGWCTSSADYIIWFADNGKGTAVCKNGTCRVACDPGYVLRKAQSSTNPYYCYNGEGSLVHN